MKTALVDTKLLGLGSTNAGKAEAAEVWKMIRLLLPNPILLAFLAICFWFSSSTEMELN